MKETTSKYNGINCRKRRVIWTILFIIFSLFSVSVIASGHVTDSYRNTEGNHELKNGSIKETNTQENTEDFDKDHKTSNEIDYQKNFEDQDNDQEQGNVINNQEDTVNSQDTKTDERKNADSLEKIEDKDNDQEQGKVISNQEDTVNSQDTKTDERKNADSLEKTEDKDNDQEQGKVISNQEDTVNSQDTKTVECKNTDSLEKIEDKDNDPKSGKVISNQEYTINSQNIKKTKSEKAGSKENNQKQENKHILNNEKSTPDNNEKSTPDNNEKSTPDNKEKSTLDNLETTTLSYHKMTAPENNEIKYEINPGVNSWKKIAMIMAHRPYSINLFYTTSDKIEFLYKDPAASMYRKVNIYLIMNQNASFPETVVDSMGKNSISFEDIVNDDTKHYVQIPATLKEDGSILEPLIFGPLSAGSYWVLVTPTENETTTSESEKKVLSASYFKVLEYEMDAHTSENIIEGENIEVNLTLKNSPAQENYTYWAALIKESPQRENENTNSSVKSKDNYGEIIADLDLIQNFSQNSTKYDSRSNKQELQNEINTFIGMGNGTVKIGEENKYTLLLSSLGLPAGNYHLFAGAYQKGKGLVGIAQKELIISHLK